MKTATHFLKCANCISCEFVWNQYPQPGNRRNVATRQYINSAKISHRIKVSPAARSFRRVVLRAAKVRQAAAVSRDFSFFLLFFNNRSCLWNHYIVGLRFQHPRFWTRDKPGGGGKALEQKWNNQTRIAAKVRALFVYSDQRSSSSSRTLSNEELSRFSRFFFIMMIFCQNQTCCLSRVRCTCDFGRRGNWWIKDAISDNWHDWKRIHLTSSSTPPFPLPLAQPPL